MNQNTTISPGIIEVDLFSEDVTDDNHPEAIRFREILESVAEEYRCRLIHYEVREGTVSFYFDSDGLMADILKILRIPPDDPSSDE